MNGRLIAQLADGTVTDDAGTIAASLRALVPPERSADRTCGSPSNLHLPAMKVGIVGLGYVGLPLAVAFAEAGREVVGVDVDPRKVERLRRGRVVHRGRPLRAARGGRASASPRPTTTGPGRLRRDRDLRPDAARQPPRARPRATWSTPPRSLSRVLQRGPAGRARVDDLPGHDARAPAARSSRSRASRPGATSTSPSRPSASTRAAPTTRCAPRRRSSAA